MFKMSTIHAYTSAVAAGIFMYLFIDGIEAWQAGLLTFAFVLSSLLSVLIKLEIIKDHYMTEKKLYNIEEKLNRLIKEKQDEDERQ